MKKVWITIGLILASSSAYAVDYIITVPDTEKARVEQAVQKGYSSSVPQALANFLFQTVRNVEISEAVKSAQKTAETSKSADIDSKLIITGK